MAYAVKSLQVCCGSLEWVEKKWFNFFFFFFNDKIFENCGYANFSLLFKCWYGLHLCTRDVGKDQWLEFLE